MAKVNRWLTLKISPTSPGNFQVVRLDSTSRSVEGKRHTEHDRAVDPFSVKAVPQALTQIFKDFAESVEQEEESDLFSEPKKKAARLDS